MHIGPGNNGGDGLVASRHLKHFGYQPTICYPKPGKLQLFTNLIKQCNDLEIPQINCDTLINEQTGNNSANNGDLSSYDLVIDSLFGFSFDGPPRGIPIHTTNIYTKETLIYTYIYTKESSYTHTYIYIYTVQSPMLV